MTGHTAHQRLRQLGITGAGLVVLVWLVGSTAVAQEASSPPPPQDDAMMHDDAMTQDAPPPMEEGDAMQNDGPDVRRGLREGPRRYSRGTDEEGGDDRQRAGRPWRRFGQLSDEEQAALIAVLTDYNPELAQGIEEEIAKGSGAEYVHRLIRERPFLLRMVHARAQDPEWYAYRVKDMQLDRDCQQLAQEYKATKAKGDAAAISAAGKALEAKIDEHFKVRRELRQLELKRLEQKLEELRTRLEERDKQAEEIKAERIKQLIGEDERTQW